MTAHLAKIALSDMQAELRDQAMRFCADKSPMSKVRALIEMDAGYDVDVWSEIGALGWTGITIPEQFGGLGLEVTDTVPIMEMMGKHLLNSPFKSTTLAAQTILHGGSEEQKQTYLAQIADGKAATLALFETDGSWDLSKIDGQEKTFVMDLDAASFVIVSVRHKGDVRLACLPTDKIIARRETIIDETRRSFSFDVPPFDDGDLMPVETTQAALARVECVANLLQAAELCGAAQACVDYTVEYLTTRKQFGKLIGSYQALKHPTVDTFIEAEKARSLVYAAATHFEKQGEGEVAVRMAAVQAQKALSYAADRSIQFHGGFGFTYDCDAQLYRRRAMFAASQYGDGAYHRAKLAELLL